jgi:hypothetical protein
MRQASDEELPTLVLPQVAYAPEIYARDLDNWAARHIDDVEHERWRALGADPSRLVSGGLTPEAE